MDLSQTINSIQLADVKSEPEPGISGEAASVQLADVKSEPEPETPGEAAGMEVVVLPTMRNLENPLLEHPMEHLSIGADKKEELAQKSLMIYGPLCWKCNGMNTWWRCQGCRKAYHKECAFFGNGNPHPIFDMDVEKAVDAKERGVAIMVKCTQCILAEETNLPESQQAPIETMHEAFTHMAHLVQNQFKTIMVEINNESVVASPELIQNTLLSIPNCYKTVEAFGADYKLILFQTIRRYGLQSEPTEAVSSILKFLREELMAAVVCWECYLHRYESRRWGKLMPTAPFFRIMETSCAVPHPLIWVSSLPDDTSRVYWPAKLLFCDEETQYVCFHCFEEKAMRKLQLGGGTKFYYFSKENPNDTAGRRKKKTQTQGTLKKSMTACEKYLKNLRERFGAKEVEIPEKAADFKGESYEHAFHKMFPNVDMDALHKARMSK